MDYINAPGTVADAQGRPQFADKIPGSVQGTDLCAAVFNPSVNELVGAIIQSGQTKSSSNETQIATAMTILGNPPVWTQSLAQEIKGFPNGFIVIDPNDSRIIWRSTAANNMTTPGASGANWAVGVLGGAPLSVVTMISSGTYTAPYADPTLRFRVRAQGPGGGGGYVGTQNAYQAAAAGGGSGGSYCEVWLTYEQLFGSKTATTASVTIGSGGTNTGAGGSTSVGSAIVVPGGNGATPGTSAGYSTLSPGAPAPALCTFPSISPTVVANIHGQPGGYGITTNPQEGGNFFGFSGAGGASMMGAAAPSVGENQTGQTGGLGAGGSGACAYNGASGTSAGFDGGTGGTGCVVIECFSGI